MNPASWATLNDMDSRGNPEAPCGTIRIVPRSVLIVDDHEPFRALARALLETEGFRVVGEAENAASAVIAASELRPDVVLLDVFLPDGRGWEIVHTVSDAGGGSAVVLTSSRDVSSFGRRLKTSGARGFLAKDELSGAALEALMR